MAAVAMHMLVLMARSSKRMLATVSRLLRLPAGTSAAHWQRHARQQQQQEQLLVVL